MIIGKIKKGGVCGMKFNDILMRIDNQTMIRVTMEMYGMKFRTDHYAEYFLDHDETDKLLNRMVTDMRVIGDGTLEVVLENK